MFGRSGPHVIIPSITGIMPISDGRKASIVDLRPGHRMDADRTGQRRGHRHRAGRAITPIAGAAVGAAVVQALPDTAHPQAQVVGGHGGGVPRPKALVTTDRSVAPVRPTIPTAHGGRSVIRSPQQPVRFSGGTRGRLPPVRPEDAERAQERRPSAELVPDGRDARQGTQAMMVPAEAVRATGARSVPGPTRIPFAGASDIRPERTMTANLPRPGQGDAAPASGGEPGRPGAWTDPQDPDWTARLMLDRTLEGPRTTPLRRWPMRRRSATATAMPAGGRSATR